MRIGKATETTRLYSLVQSWMANTEPILVTRFIDYGMQDPAREGIRIQSTRPLSSWASEIPVHITCEKPLFSRQSSMYQCNAWNGQFRNSVISDVPVTRIRKIHNIQWNALLLRQQMKNSSLWCSYLSDKKDQQLCNKCLCVIVVY